MLLYTLNMVKLNPYLENIESILNKSADFCRIDNCYSVLIDPTGEVISTRSETFSIEFFSHDQWQTFEYMILTEKVRVVATKSADYFTFAVCTDKGLCLCDYLFRLPIEEDFGFNMDFSPMNVLNAEYLD
jgi:hypothetical protein